MESMKQFAVVVVLSLALMCCVVGGALAQGGGVYVDDIRITNDGKDVFSENFDDGNISDWRRLSEASLVTLKKDPPLRALWMNEHGKQTCSAHHALSVDTVGALDMSASVFVAPKEEHYQWKDSEPGYFYMALECRETPNSEPECVRIDVMLYPADQSCKVAVKRYGKLALKFVPSTRPVMPTGQWVRLALRLNPLAGMATVYINDAPVASAQYDPTHFPKFTNLALLSNFGDGSAMVE